jgi:hypothetical protein
VLTYIAQTKLIVKTLPTLVFSAYQGLIPTYRAQCRNINITSILKLSERYPNLQSWRLVSGRGITLSKIMHWNTEPLNFRFLGGSSLNAHIYVFIYILLMMEVVVI